MAKFADITSRVTFIAQAIATMGVDPKWDAAVTNYVSWDARCRAQEEFAPMALRAERHAMIQRDMERMYGRTWRQHPDCAADLAVIAAENDADEKTLREQFYEPFWAAQHELAATPAPSLLAAAFKAAFLEFYQLYNDSTFDRDNVEIIDADLARFAMPLAA